jgi:N-acetylneuraminic acid mutarotase
MAKISGCYRWNDILAVSGGTFLLDLPLRVNGTSYAGAMIYASAEDETMAALFEKNETMTIVYLFGAGWIRAVSLQDENPVLAQSDLWQTWDFGEEQEIPDDFYEYLMANASPVASAEAVNLSYGGRIIASVEDGQSATLHCRGKSMNSDLLLLVPRRKSASGGGAEMNVAFGDTAPDDTSKLWIKTAEPESLEARLSFDFVGNEQMQAATLALPAHVYSASATAVGKKIYIFGGGASYSKAIYVYDTEANSIEKLTVTLPKEATGNASAAVGKMIYIFGGKSESGNLGKSKAIYSFDTETQAAQTLTAVLPEDRTNMAAAAVGSKIYLFGGAYYSSGDQPHSTIYMFNAESEAITSLSAKLPVNTHQACAVAVGSRIYVFGGHNGSDALNTIRVFDTDTQTLETLDVTLPTPVYMFSGAAVGSAIYLFGGYIGGAGLNTIVRFNAETNEVETLGVTIPKKNWGTPAASIGSRIYYFDGHSSSSDHTVNTFVVNIDLPENHMLIETSGAGNTVRLFPNMEIGVKNVYLGNADGKGERVPAALYKDGAWTEI